MTTAASLTAEQVTEIYTEFSRTAVDEYNANGRFKPTIMLVARRIDGHVIGEIPEAITNSLMRDPAVRLEFVIRSLLTEGTPARDAVSVKPDAVVIITEAFDVPVPRDADGNLVELTPEQIAKATETADEVLSVQVFTATEAWAGYSPIDGTTRRATFSSDVSRILTFVTTPLETPTVH